MNSDRDIEHRALRAFIKRHSSEEPSPHLDAAILDAAHRAVERDTRDSAVASIQGKTDERPRDARDSGVASTQGKTDERPTDASDSAGAATQRSSFAAGPSRTAESRARKPV